MQGKIPKANETTMSSETQTMLSKETIFRFGKQRILHIPFIILRQNGMNGFIMRLKPLNCFITCTKLKMTTPKQIREPIWPGQWAVSLNIKSVSCHSPTVKRHCCFFHSGRRAKWTSSRYCLLVCPQVQRHLQEYSKHLASVLEDRYKSVPIYKQCSHIGRLIYSGKDRLVESSTSAS